MCQSTAFLLYFFSSTFSASILSSPSPLFAPAFSNRSDPRLAAPQDGPNRATPRNETNRATPPPQNTPRQRKENNGIIPDTRESVDDHEIPPSLPPCVTAWTHSVDLRRVGVGVS
ncbi:hypothetical protein M427DRAFT_56316 [Gonapodya prolifera JEL478]|uniref:Secreted protein n=1 Tax=Gonapodya prolifera (strain JEL478) TaxID=1344416 RepID=A0A139AHZ0_GONPJ|nr:hypothetical protein M427DRAFT_56316 [Gonapodya prolifera JEL478]|eukprot:KXS16023.1 hypothetical protein M427DRAFT_56316 [Gonapodya prolifera JEL478]